MMQSIPTNTESLIFPCSMAAPSLTKNVEFPSNSKSSSSSYSYSFLSLELCTESLGSENGISGGIDEFPFPPMERQRQRQRKRADEEAVKPEKKGWSFPPPLTSISGSECVRVRSHREGGRLVMEASAFSSSGGCFVAERGNGRLRLSLLKDDEEVDGDEDEEDEEGLCGHDYRGEKCVIGRCNGSREREMNTLPFSDYYYLVA